MLILEPIEGPLTVLPTHRVLLGLDADALDRLQRAAARAVRGRGAPRRDDLLAAFSSADASAGGDGRFGLWTRQQRRDPARPADVVRAAGCPRAAPPSGGST